MSYNPSYNLIREGLKLARSPLLLTAARGCPKVTLVRSGGILSLGAFLSRLQQMFLRQQQGLACVDPFFWWWELNQPLVIYC